MSAWLDTALATAHSLRDPGLFAFTVLVLNATPGVDMVYTVARTLQGGLRAGVAAAIGISLGCLVHALLAAFGLAALLAVSSWAFLLLKSLGAAYLVWLAWGMLRAAWRGESAASAGLDGSSQRFWPVLRQGLLTNVLNPKVALFFLAFLPQFIAPEAEHKTLAFLVLGVWLTLQSLLFLGLLVLLTLRLRRLGNAPGLGRVLNGLGGTLFLLLAARLANAEAH
jgi:threonine/homoserine/homoserine lactone efflux protein